MKPGEVAIKLLQYIFSGDPERLARFERESELSALRSLPNLAAIHELEETHGEPFLDMGLVEEQTLAERLSNGLPFVQKYLDVCRQIAEGSG